MRVRKAQTPGCFCEDERRWRVENRSSVLAQCRCRRPVSRQCWQQGHLCHQEARRGPREPRAPTLGSWSSGLENRTDWLNVSWAWLLFMTETVFFTTCPGRTAPNFTILLAGSRTKICETRHTVGREGLSVNGKNKHHTPALVSLGGPSLSVPCTLHMRCAFMH